MATVPQDGGGEVSLHDDAATPPLWRTLLLTAASGGMGWGIRGQYGHETGAMIAGVLVALVVGLLFCRKYSSLSVARVVALTAVGISFGGSMTYGQTIGLTHDPELHGDWAALTWGMLGLFLKGGIWIGFAGVMMGMGLSVKSYRAAEVALLFVCLTVLLLLGVFLLNEPHDPANRQLPRIYFSDHWIWEAGKVDLRPRPERWGGLLVALIGLFAYVSIAKKDHLARNIGLAGVVFGGIGFSGGQVLQAFHSWNEEAIRLSWFGEIDPYINWWNMMEITFGATMGFGLGLAVWMSRHHLPKQPVEADVEFKPQAELVALAIHAVAIVAWNFGSLDGLDSFADHAITMGILPVVLIIGGRYSSYLIALPLVTLPIAGKTLREVCFNHEQMTPVAGSLLLVAAPVAIMLVAAWWLAKQSKQGKSGHAFCRVSLLLTSWTYFALNFVFFQYPWPWVEITARTPSALIFAACLVALTVASIASRTSRD